MTEETASGLILPSYSDSNNRGFHYKTGYYFALNDHYDLTVSGDYYTNGSWNAFWISYAKIQLPI
jgi:lipopolysaccharide assembly outer membrane protein LptD (OstA)